MALLSGKSILVAEDADITADMLSYVLEQEGANICRAHNGKEAIELALGEPFDAILMDINMPEGNGLLATQEIRKRIAKCPPIIAVTGEDSLNLEELVKMGFSEYITKPIDFAQLYSIIFSHVSHQ
ncbi:response regulator [Alteromonas facilis]|uniref:response regulator n=1 Tax=Alteromonas facilis TaxID=2048004 RepID=UPI000C28BF4C|nr:response regulator [Alteromonas facilis]